MNPTKEHDVSATGHGTSANSVSWFTPTLVCFGAVHNLTASGSRSFNETFTSVDPDNGQTTTFDDGLPNHRA